MHEDIVAVFGGNERLAEVVYVIELIAEARSIVEIDEFRGPIPLRLVVENADGLAGCAEQHFLTANHEVAVRIRSIQRVLLRRFRDQVLDQRARKPQSIVVVNGTATG
jgi:hypothetical protein